MKVIVKHRLFTWFEQVPNTVQPDGPPVWIERIAHHGDELDIPEDNPHLARGRQPDIDAFYSDDDAELIRAGTYRGRDAETLYRMRAGIKPESPIEAVEGEGINVSTLESDELGDYIRENDLTVPQVQKLIPEDADMETLEKFYDAEVHASDQNPRKGVTDYIDARMAALKS